MKGHPQKPGWWSALGLGVEIGVAHFFFTKRGCKTSNQGELNEIGPAKTGLVNKSYRAEVGCGSMLIVATWRCLASTNRHREDRPLANHAGKAMDFHR